MQTLRQHCIHRRTPRRKLVFSSSDDELDNSPQSISSVHILRQEQHQDEQFALQAESIDVLLNRSTRSKLEHYGFQQLNRSVSSLRQGKRPTSSTDNPNKKMRPVDVTPTAALKKTFNPMQTRTQSSTDSHSDQLVKLFDKTLSTVTPNRENKENEINDEIFMIRDASKRGRPLPLCLSDNEKNFPVLTVITSEENSNNNKRIHDDHDDDVENSDLCRSIKRTKVHDESNKENELIINRPSMIKRSRRGVGLIRSLTEPNEEQIKASVELGTNRDLIGDRSRTYLLPRCKSRKHPDLACISPETMIDVLRNVYSNEIEQLHVIDCRYPYEYEGGHIESAKNIYTRSKIFEEYFRQPLESKDATKRNIFIFHCEFSSERAPSLLRYFRSEDRSIHERSYPQLHYPEIYLLEGGYKALYEYSKEFCVPQFYRTMIDAAYQEAYREYRSEAKQHEKFSGNKDKSEGGRRTRVLTFRSCLSFSSQTNYSSSSNIQHDLRYINSPSDY